MSVAGGFVVNSSAIWFNRHNPSLFAHGVHLFWAIAPLALLTSDGQTRWFHALKHKSKNSSTQALLTTIQLNRSLLHDSEYDAYAPELVTQGIELRRLLTLTHEALEQKESTEKVIADCSAIGYDPTVFTSHVQHAEDVITEIALFTARHSERLAELQEEVAVFAKSELAMKALNGISSLSVSSADLRELNNQAERF